MEGSEGEPAAKRRRREEASQALLAEALAEARQKAQLAPPPLSKPAPAPARSAPPPSKPKIDSKLSHAACLRAVGRAPLSPGARAAAPAWDQGSREFWSFGPEEAAVKPAAQLPARVAALADRPRIALDARSAKVPRVTRQAVLDRLLERELEGGSAVAEASSAAVAVEEQLYARSANAALYRNFVAQHFAAPRQVAVSAPPPPSPEAVEALLSGCRAVRSAQSLSFFHEVLQARAHSLFLLWEKPFFMPRGPEMPHPEATPPAGEEDALPSLSPMAAAEAAPSLSPMAAAAAAPEPAAAAAAASEPAPDREGGVEAAVRAAVLDALASTEPPLPEVVAASIAERAVRKLCARHVGATDAAAILGRDGRRVRELVAAYVQHVSSRNE